MLKRVLSCLVVFSLAACDQQPTMQAGGTFQVFATMTSNSCGPQSMSLSSALNYSAGLGVSAETSTATWSVAAVGVMASGTYTDATREFIFQAENAFEVRAANTITGQAACVMNRIDQIDGTIQGALDTTSTALDGGMLSLLDAGPAASFVATETIVYGPVAGADCSDQVGAGDGQFSVLPCEITYQMTGAMSGPLAN